MRRALLALVLACGAAHAEPLPTSPDAAYHQGEHDGYATGKAECRERAAHPAMFALGAPDVATATANVERAKVQLKTARAALKAAKAHERALKHAAREAARKAREATRANVETDPADY